MPDPPHGPLQTILKSQLTRLLLIGFLILLLQIPIGLIAALINGRSMTRQEAVEDITGTWGRSQTIIGPAIAVPYLEHRTSEDSSGKKTTHVVESHAVFLPDDLRVQGTIESETRYRGIFEVPVYRMTLEVSGRFSRPDFSAMGVAGGDVLWDRAQVWLRISDAHAIQNQAGLKWGTRSLPFAPGTGEFARGESGVHAALGGHLAPGTHEFSFSLSLNGSVGVFFAPLGEQTVVVLRGDWSEPGFKGTWLPVERSVGQDGFEATWSVPSLGRNYPQRWKAGAAAEDQVGASSFGVELQPHIDPYRMSLRSVKYELLFLALTFVALWLFEILVKARIHAVQYLLVGAAMCLFYLLLLSLAEHLGFLTAYLLASAAIVGLVATYCAAVLGRAWRAGVIGAVVGGLYAYLYVLLNSQDYALLIGSVGLFLILAAVMYLTRHVDWHGAAD